MKAKNLRKKIERKYNMGCNKIIFEYANQKVIEELENAINNSITITNGSGENFMSISDVKERIKQLKQ
jgi:hypothetical protein